MIFIAAKFRILPEGRRPLARDLRGVHPGNPRRAGLPVVRLILQDDWSELGALAVRR